MRNTKLNGSNKLFKKLFNLLQRDLKIVLFTEENINEKLAKRLKKSTYAKDNEFVKLFNDVDYKFFKEIKKFL